MNKLISALASIAAAMVLASCSIINGDGPVFRRDKTPKPIEQTTQKQEDKQPDAAAQTPEQKRPVASDSKLTGKLDGQWFITKAGSHAVVAEESPYVYFEEVTGKFYANDGCNVINGSFSCSGDKVNFTHAISTKMSCPDVVFASSIDRALGRENPVKIELQDKGQGTVMTMKNNAGSAIMTLCRINQEQLNGQWYVKEIGEQKVDDENVNIFLDFADMSTHGNTGCNFFNGKIVINPSIVNSVSFTQMGATMRLCPDSGIEMAMMVALEQATAYRLDGGKLLLLDSAGKTLMTLARK